LIESFPTEGLKIADVSLIEGTIAVRNYWFSFASPRNRTQEAVRSSRDAAARLKPPRASRSSGSSSRSTRDRARRRPREYSGHSWEYEDRVYRFYHCSFKVYWLQLNDHYRQIISEGTGKTWTADHNERWLKETRPIVEAFFHARYMLEMAVSYGKELDRP